jgi:DNA-binding MarR family transcriptional regulator
MSELRHHASVASVEDIVWEYRAGHTSRDAVEKATAALLGLSAPDARCWHLLQQHGPMTAGAIANALGLTSGAVTAMIDRLERGGHVQRVRDTVDRRRVIVDVTPDARRRSAELYKPLASGLRERLARYSQEEQELLCEFLRWDREQLDRHRARLERREARVRSAQR